MNETETLYVPCHVTHKGPTITVVMHTNLPSHLAVLGTKLTCTLPYEKMKDWEVTKVCAGFTDVKDIAEENLNKWSLRCDH